MWLFSKPKKMYIHENNLFEHISHHPKGFIAMKEPTCATFESAIMENHVFSDKDPGEGFLEVKSVVLAKNDDSYSITDSTLGYHIPITELSERKRERIMHHLPDTLEEGIFKNTVIEYHTQKYLDKHNISDKKPIAYIILNSPRVCAILYTAESQEKGVSREELQQKQFNDISEILQQRIKMKLL
jgi:hypothetical protein